MYRYSMFSDKNEIINMRSSLYSKDRYEYLPMSNFDLYYSLISNTDFMNLQDLQGFAIKNLQKFIKELFDFVAPDIYNWINFTCDYLLKFHLQKINALEYWENFDKEIKEDPEQKTYNFFIKQFKTLNPPIKDHLIYDDTNFSIKVSQLCSNFGLYVYKNLKDMFWYKDNMEKRYDRFLLNRFLKAESCSFTDSDYYILEKITNINSVIELANKLSLVLSVEKAHALLNAAEDLRYKHEIDNLIQHISHSPLTFSKSKLINVLFCEAEKHMDFQGELNLTLRYVQIQFAKVNEILSGYLYCAAYKKFYEYADIIGSVSSDYYIAEIMKLNEADFQKYLSCEPAYLRDALIKDQISAYKFKNKTKANDTAGYLNAYIQKKFISAINYPVPPSLPENIVGINKENKLNLKVEVKQR